MNSRRYGFGLQRLATILAVMILTLSLTAALTGVLIAFYYQPTSGGAYNSIERIVTEVPNGWLIQRLHSIAGNGIIAVALGQIVVMFLGERFRPSWLTAWISGIFLTLTTIALSWTAINLDWSQVGYWRFKIELGTIEAIPVIGPTLRDILIGGAAIGTVTIEHLYALHSYVLSTIAIILAVIHLVGLLFQEQESPMPGSSATEALAPAPPENQPSN